MKIFSACPSDELMNGDWERGQWYIGSCGLKIMNKRHKVRLEHIILGIAINTFVISIVVEL